MVGLHLHGVQMNGRQNKIIMKDEVPGAQFKDYDELFDDLDLLVYILTLVFALCNIRLHLTSLTCSSYSKKFRFRVHSIP